jgi:hypothetical protein
MDSVPDSEFVQDTAELTEADYEVPVESDAEFVQDTAELTESDYEAPVESNAEFVQDTAELTESDYEAPVESDAEFVQDTAELTESDYEVPVESDAKFVQDTADLTEADYDVDSEQFDAPPFESFDGEESTLNEQQYSSEDTGSNKPAEFDSIENESGVAFQGELAQEFPQYFDEIPQQAEFENESTSQDQGFQDQAVSPLMYEGSVEETPAEQFE